MKLLEDPDAQRMGVGAMHRQSRESLFTSGDFQSTVEIYEVRECSEQLHIICRRQNKLACSSLSTVHRILEQENWGFDGNSKLVSPPKIPMGCLPITTFNYKVVALPSI